MRARERQRVVRQSEADLRFWRPRLVREWSVVLDWEDPAPDGINARVWAPDDYHRTTIRPGLGHFFSADVTDLEREVTIVHELLHLALRDLRWAVAKLGGGSGLGTVYEHFEEGYIDRQACALVELRHGEPLPSGHGLIDADSQVR